MSEEYEILIPEHIIENLKNDAKMQMRNGEEEEFIKSFLIELATDMLDDEEVELPNDEEYVEDFLDTLMDGIILRAEKECLEEEKDWPEVTDCDKLTSALMELDEEGIVAREHFTCCGSCGASEIHDEADENHFGYVFYHVQDTESAQETGNLYLAYGHVGLAKKSTVEIAEIIVDKLKNFGLDVEWNGNINTRILVKNLKWQKRIDLYR